MKKKKPVREFYVLIQPFERYDTIYFCNRNRETKKGRPIRPYFLENPSERSEHTFEESKETVSFLKMAYPDRFYKTISKVEFSNNPELKSIMEKP